MEHDAQDVLDAVTEFVENVTAGGEEWVYAPTLRRLLGLEKISILPEEMGQ